MASEPRPMMLHTGIVCLARMCWWVSGNWFTNSPTEVTYGTHMIPHLMSKQTPMGWSNLVKLQRLTSVLWVATGLDLTFAVGPC